MTAADVLVWGVVAFDAVGSVVVLVVTEREARDMSITNPAPLTSDEDGRGAGDHGRHCQCCAPTERIKWDERAEMLAAVLAGLHKW